MKRAVKINGLDMELVLSKVTSVKTENEMIHLDKMRDGTWRLIYNENMIPDFTKVKSLEIVRED
jgi:hypothetical protein